MGGRSEQNPTNPGDRGQCQQTGSSISGGVAEPRERMNYRKGECRTSWMIRSE